MVLILRILSMKIRQQTHTNLLLLLLLLLLLITLCCCAQSLHLRKHDCGECIRSELNGLWSRCDYNGDDMINTQEEKICGNDFIFEYVETDRQEVLQQTQTGKLDSSEGLKLYLFFDQASDLSSVDSTNYSYFFAESFETGDGCNTNRNGKVDLYELPCVSRGFSTLKKGEK